MKVHDLKNYSPLKSLFVMVFVVLSGSSKAATIDLTSSPLVVTTGIEPNIQLILDDSGSMDWEVMIAEGRVNSTDIELKAGVAFHGKPNKYLVRPEIHPGFAYDGDVVPPITTYADAWVNKNPDANTIYYNTNIEYEPWPGLDTDGTALYTDADYTKIYEDPTKIGETSVHNNDKSHDPDELYSVDLSISFPFYDHNLSSGGGKSYSYAVFYTWTDDDSDGIVETTDTHTRVDLNSASVDTSKFGNSRTIAEEQQNFANWMQYYRKRTYLAKAALGNMIYNASNSRMGLYLISQVFSYDMATLSVEANRIALLKALYSSEYDLATTPLRTALNEIGTLFAGTHATKSSPILDAANGGTCQQNFQLLMTDGSWNGGAVAGISNEDGDSDTNFDGGNYADSYSGTLADIAMYYYENDLNTSLDNDVPTITGVDEADHQHLVTYTVAFGVQGTIDTSLNPDDGTVTWPEPVTDTSTTIDDLWHAAYNGRGSYLSASNIEELTSSLDQIIENINERSANASAVAINSAQLNTETVIYLAEFNTSRWQGEIRAFGVANASTGELNTNANWEAGIELTNRDLTSNPREIITYNATTKKGVAFEWSKLSNEQKNDLKTNASGGTDSAVEAQARLDYLRGDRTNETTGYSFRERSNLLGDVVNSGPVYVEVPNLNYPNVAPFPTGVDSYQTFSNNSTRDGVVYVAANDGMLHAFHEDDGEELFAFIPSTVFSDAINEGLHYLTQTNYVHKFYNDLTPTISDVYAALDGGATDEWTSILIGGLRGGGRGLYALNVNDPTSFDEANAEDIVLWEFTSTDDPDLGYTYSEPQVALANNGQWVAIFGNGYNNTGDGEAKLFILDIEAGVDGTWSAGDYVEITTGSGSAADVNGLSSPVLADTDGDGDVDRVYAGDLEGQLWVFDLSASSSASWALANASPLFTTVGNRPITAQPEISIHPTQNTSGSTSPNILVFFGSGQYLAQADISTTYTNHFYGVWDKDDFALDNTDLVEQTFDSDFTGRVLTNNAVDYDSKYGWYITLNTSERSVTSAIARFDIVFFNTFSPSSDACTNGGSGFKFAVDAATGGALDEPVLDANSDGIIDSSDLSYYGSTSKAFSAIEQDGYLPEPVFVENVSYTGKEPTVVKESGYLESGRLSWQELLE